MVNYRRLDAVFAALADPTRRRMIERLARRSMSVGEMSEGLAMSQPGVSKHVKVLERAGLLKREIVGRVHRCKLEPKVMEAASTWLDDQRRFWSGALERLDVYLARTPKSKAKKGR
ncbi:MAG TPA: metalloregulator ArsR/SmtB family transcription factor [Candidatus Cybelea sp.]